MKKHLLILIAFFFASINMYAQSTWTQKANFGGTARNFCFGFSVGQYGYIGSGYAGSSYSTGFWQYDPVANSWSQKASITGGRASAMTFVIGSKAYVCCGLGSVFYNDLWEYDPAGNSWTAKADLPAIGRYGGFGFAINGLGYVGGGNPGGGSSQCLNDFYEYNPTSNSWSTKPDFPGYPRYGMGCFAINNKGYAGIGLNESSGTVFYDDWYEYDPVGNGWATKTSLPGIARNYPFCFVIGNQGYLGAGENFVALGDFWRYNAANDSWHQEPNYGGGIRWSLPGFSIGNVGYAGTGSDFTLRYNDFWEFSPGTSSIESLADIQFVLYPNPSNGFVEILYSKGNSTTMQFDLFSSDGKKVFSKEITATQKKFIVDLRSLSNGVYFYKFTDNTNMLQAGKLVLNK